MRTLTSVVADVNGGKGVIFVITVAAGAPGNMPWPHLWKTGREDDTHELHE